MCTGVNTYLCRFGRGRSDHCKTLCRAGQKVGIWNMDEMHLETYFTIQLILLTRLQTTISKQFIDVPLYNSKGQTNVNKKQPNQRYK